jgi:2-iminobutanoate/2-iminopropanoate deaminase
MRIISTPNAPRPRGHYAQATVHHGLVFVAGQLAVRPDGTRLAGEPAGAQLEQIFRNVDAILQAAGTGLDRILSVTIFVAAMELWEEVNAAFARVFGEHRPARAVIPAAGLPQGMLMEVQVVAATSEDAS